MHGSSVPDQPDIQLTRAYQTVQTDAGGSQRNAR